MPVSEFAGDCHICMAVAVVYGVSTESSPNSIGTWGNFLLVCHSCLITVRPS